MTSIRRSILAVAIATLMVFSFSVASVYADSPEPAINEHIGHNHHHHKHNPAHPTEPAGKRFTTSRSGHTLELPTEEDAFFFVIYGDRTGGPVDGVSVLADAVRDTNMLEPDLVMTVGDMVQGYTEKDKWVEQMEEYKSIMDQLLCPWFPVAGNHDVRWRGPKGAKKPAGENEQHFETHFGPLWYAFEHKNSWFIALYSDEGNPETGEKSHKDPECQRMSPEQFEWLASVLEKAKDADHVFLFLHHPRWLGGNYGDDWNRVHDLLVKAGNVSAVFAGHIHHMRYDPKDGIEYVTLATVGGGQSSLVPSAGYLHQFHIVTVRKNQLAIAAVPVGDIIDVRDITGEMQDECAALTRQRPQIRSDVAVDLNGHGHGKVHATLKNSATRPITITAMLDSMDSRWRVLPDHTHVRIDPGAEHTFTFDVSRIASAIDNTYRPVEFLAQVEYHTNAYAYPLPEMRIAVPLGIDLPSPPVPAKEQVLMFDGQQAYLSYASENVPVPDGPFTLECWMNAHSFGKRVGLVSKAESSDYGIFVNKGTPHFSVFLGDKYASTKGDKGMLKENRWYHVAGVYDGAEVRLYVDGKLVASAPGVGHRVTNDFPLIVGGDVTKKAVATSYFDGAIDEVRLSTVARYKGETFSPQRRLQPDESTMLLLHADGTIGPWLTDDSGHKNHIRIENGVVVAPAP